jgi:hypothetical protein
MSSIQYLPVGYYAGLLTSEYKPAVKMNAWLTAVLNIATDISTCLASMSAAFDLDYALGVQLDMLGQIVGVARTLPFQPSGGVSPVLDDLTYRLLLKATIASDAWDGKIGSLYPIWGSLFTGGRIAIIDNQNMTATVALSGSFSSITQDMIAGYATNGASSGPIINGLIIPKPQAVQYNYSFNDLPVFGFDREDAFIAGLGTGKWS